MGEGLPGIGGSGVGSVGVRIGSVFSGSVGVRIPGIGGSGSVSGTTTDRRPVCDTRPGLGVGECLTGGVLMGTDRRPVSEPVVGLGVGRAGSGIGGIGGRIIFNAWLTRPVGLRDPVRAERPVVRPERLSWRVPTVPTD